jgi:hypothetical protein
MLFCDHVTHLPNRIRHDFYPSPPREARKDQAKLTFYAVQSRHHAFFSRLILSLGLALRYVRITNGQGPSTGSTRRRYQNFEGDITWPKWHFWDWVLWAIQWQAI